MKLAKSKVVFEPIEHTYTLKGEQLSGVTRMIDELICGGKYANIPKDRLKAAASRGTDVHDEISLYENSNGVIEPSSIEGKNYVEKVKPSLNIISSEYLVSDNKNFASCIDLVGEKDGGVILYDIKTNKEGVNKEYVTWQLSCYAYLFELQNKKIKVDGLAYIWLRDDNVEVGDVQRVDTEHIINLMNAYINKLPFENPLAKPLASESSAMVKYIQFEDAFRKLKAEMDALDKLRSAALDQVKKEMDEQNITSLETEHLKITRVADTVVESFDTKKFEAEHPEIAAQYKKISSRKGYLKITVKNK